MGILQVYSSVLSSVKPLLSVWIYMGSDSDEVALKICVVFMASI